MGTSLILRKRTLTLHISFESSRPVNEAQVYAASVGAFTAALHPPSFEGHSDMASQVLGSDIAPKNHTKAEVELTVIDTFRKNLVSRKRYNEATVYLQENTKHRHWLALGKQRMLQLERRKL
ncbi:hypothetical protein FA15DRAFT_706560 [Coprinopsis marcescibilis]|uniref:Uncharacterized protein n=1 Tax=Coprinopsis marcescibilis TaxID=230819 RepID=A0A5C3KPF6_COPMA|nr:hypothetical protein FA15DRAFT_706560 [Coprinopsis marcescibilis]